MYGSIYKITNKINNKIYVGKTIKCIEKRFKEHITAAYRYDKNNQLGKKQPKSRLYPAIITYGVEQFYIELLDIAESLEELNNKERYWINILKTCDYNYGYNISPGGDGGALFQGHKQSQYAKELTSIRFKNKKQDIDFINKRMKPHRDTLPKIQCLDNGKIYLNHLELDKTFNGDSRHALKNNGRFRGLFYIELNNEHNQGYTEDERLKILNDYKKSLSKKFNKSHINLGNMQKQRHYELYKLKINNINVEQLIYDFIIVGLGKHPICNKYNLTMTQLNLFLQENNLHRPTYKRPDTSVRNKIRNKK